VATAPDHAPRSVAELVPEQRQRLERAHRRLREAVEAYEQYLGGPLEPGREVPVQDAGAVAKAQAAVDEAEAELWRVREELLGWTRPPWAPAAALVPDWFSDEDRVYDDIETRPSS
jgi:hypothetical protein